MEVRDLVTQYPGLPLHDPATFRGKESMDSGAWSKFLELSYWGMEKWLKGIAEEDSVTQYLDTENFQVGRV